MKTGIRGLVPALLLCPGLATAGVWINEIHYDNAGTDTGERIEVAGDAGTSLTGWSLHFYNGADRRVYATRALTGTLLASALATTLAASLVAAFAAVSGAASARLAINAS